MMVIYLPGPKEKLGQEINKVSWLQELKYEELVSYYQSVLK